MSNYETQMCLARQSVGKQDRAVLAKSNAVAYPVQNNKKNDKNIHDLLFRECKP